MDFQEISPDEEFLRATAPVDEVEIVMSDRLETYVLGGFEGEKLLCYGIFSHIPGPATEVWLEYLYTVPGRREQGLCCALLKEAGIRFYDSGIDKILIHEYVDEEDAEELDEFITNRGFIPLSVNNWILTYKQQEMVDDRVIDKIIGNRDKLPKVYTMEEIGEDRLNVFQSDHNRTDFFFYKEDCDPRYCRFSMENNRISAALLASMPMENTLYISGVYMDEIAEKKNLFLILFSECLNQAFIDDPEDDLKVVIVVNKKRIYDGLMEVFSPPEEECLAMEYMLLLNQEWRESNV